MLAGARHGSLAMVRGDGLCGLAGRYAIGTPGRSRRPRIERTRMALCKWRDGVMQERRGSARPRAGRSSLLGIAIRGQRWPERAHHDPLPGQGPDPAKAASTRRDRGERAPIRWRCDTGTVIAEGTGSEHCSVNRRSPTRRSRSLAAGMGRVAAAPADERLKPALE